MLARAVTKCDKAYAKRLARLISYIIQTKRYRQSCVVGNTIQDFKLALCQEIGESASDVFVCDMVR